MASADPSDPQNTSEVWQMLKSAFGEARANNIIVFFIIAGVAWVALAVLEKIAIVIKSFSGEDGIVVAEAGDMITAVGTVLIFAVVFGWLATRRTHQRELNEIRADIALIKNHLGITDETEESDGEVHTDDQRNA